MCLEEGRVFKVALTVRGANDLPWGRKGLSRGPGMVERNCTN